MAVTIKDIAKRCGISYSAVSGILGNRPHEFSEELRRCVAQTAREMGYRPNAAGRAMRTGSLRTIAFIRARQQGTSPFQPNQFLGVQSHLIKNNYTLCTAEIELDLMSDKGYLPQIISTLFADGLVVSHSIRIFPEFNQIIEATHLSAVWTDAKRDYNSVYIDHTRAASEATERLFKLGHRRILYVYTSESLSNANYHQQDRLAGYLQAMKTAGLEPETMLADKTASYSERGNAIKARLERADRPSAILTAYPEYAILSIMTASRDFSWTVPGCPISSYSVAFSARNRSTGSLFNGLKTAVG